MLRHSNIYKNECYYKTSVALELIIPCQQQRLRVTCDLVKETLERKIVLFFGFSTYCGFSQSHVFSIIVKSP